MFKLHQEDCRKTLAEMTDNSVDLIATDPPYYRVKANNWDNQWSDEQAFLEWLESIVKECARVLKPNGALYLFASPYMAAKVEVLIDRYLSVQNHIVWVKTSGMHKRQNRASLRKYFSATERIIFATPQGQTDSKTAHKMTAKACAPIIEYLRSALLASGKTRSEIDREMGIKMAGHWFGFSQWSLPSESRYQALQSILKGHLMRPYREIKQQHQEAMEQADHPSRRHFDLAGREWYTDAWVASPVQYYQGKHPCEKPLAMMEHIITASSRPGDLVFDPFTGGGTTGAAAIRTGRRFVGCEMDGEYHQGATERLKMLAQTPVG